MLIDPALWPKLHGASTHFPMGLTMAAALFEVAAAFLPVESPHRRNLRAAGYYTIILGALGTFPAVLSGLFMTHGETMRCSFITCSCGRPSRGSSRSGRGAGSSARRPRRSRTASISSRCCSSRA
jgi:hypothetical protein